MSDDTGWSEEKTTIFGDKYTQHYDKDGKEVSTSEEKTTIFGDKYTQHYDNDRRDTGTSEEKTTILGDHYTQHYDNDRRDIGTSEEKTTILGDHYTQHYDNDRRDIGTSENKTTIFGDRYTQHRGGHGAPVSRVDINKDLSSIKEKHKQNAPARTGSISSSSHESRANESSGMSGWLFIIIIGGIGALLLNSNDNPNVNGAPSSQQISNYSRPTPNPKPIPKLAPKPPPEKSAPTRELMKLTSSYGRVITLTNKGLSGIYGHEDIPFEWMQSITLKDINGHWSIIIEGRKPSLGNSLRRIRRDLGCPTGERVCRNFYNALLATRKEYYSRG